VAAEVPDGVVTVMSTVPLPGGLVTVICVAESAVIVPAVLPKLTLVAPVRSVPVIVTRVSGHALAGEISVTAGGGGGAT
jgi:hypothetical protein